MEKLCGEVVSAIGFPTCLVGHFRSNDHLLHTSISDISFSPLLCQRYFLFSFEAETNIRRNRRDLAEGWYDPSVLRKAQEDHSHHPSNATVQRHHQANKATSGTSKDVNPLSPALEDDDDDDDDKDTDDSDDFGPPLPSSTNHHRSSHPVGPKPPKTQDLALRRELSTEASQQASTLARKQLAQARRIDTLQQKHLLDELAPRAAPGTRDRQLEKKREKADAVRAFAASKTDAVGAVEDVPDDALFGGGAEDDGDGGGIEGYKKRKKEAERKKTEMEVRREENARAKEVERQERREAYKRREEEVMRGLVEVARARFG